MRYTVQEIMDRQGKLSDEKQLREQQVFELDHLIKVLQIYKEKAQREKFEESELDYAMNDNNPI